MRQDAGTERDLLLEVALGEAITAQLELRRVNGIVYIIEDDEIQFEENEKGNLKIDENGNLLGGMSYSTVLLFLPLLKNAHVTSRS